MKKILYSLFATGLLLTGCTGFDDVSSVSYGDGPAISIDILATTDSTFTFKISPATGTLYYSYLVEAVATPKELDGQVLIRNGYSGIVSGVQTTEKQSTYTVNMRSGNQDNGNALGLPNTTYQIYAVAASKEGVTGDVGIKSVTTTDLNIPAIKGTEVDSISVDVTFTESVKLGEGKVTAQIYRKWDLINPIALEEFEIDVNNDIVTFTAPDMHAGTVIAISWEAGAFVDLAGNKCKEQLSLYNFTSGKFEGVFFQIENVEFEIVKDNFISPAIGSYFNDWQAFEGVIKFDFDIYRDEANGKTGDVKTSYRNANRTITVNLPMDAWEISGNELKFKLIEAPTIGDTISVIFDEGVIYDIYGNSNVEFISNEVKWNYGTAPAE